MRAWLVHTRALRAAIQQGGTPTHASKHPWRRTSVLKKSGVEGLSRFLMCCSSALMSSPDGFLALQHGAEAQSNFCLTARGGHRLYPGVSWCCGGCSWRWAGQLCRAPRVDAQRQVQQQVAQCSQSHKVQAITRSSRRRWCRYTASWQGSMHSQQQPGHSHEAVVVDGVDVPLLADHVAEAAAGGVFEGDAPRLVAQDALNVVAVVQLVVKACDGRCFSTEEISTSEKCALHGVAVAQLVVKA